MGAEGPEQQKQPMQQVTFRMYLASRGWLLYASSVEHVVAWTIRKMQPVCFENFCHFPSSCEKRYQALSTFPYCKRWKVGRGLGTRVFYIISAILWCQWAACLVMHSSFWRQLRKKHLLDFLLHWSKLNFHQQEVHSCYKFPLPLRSYLEYFPVRVLFSQVQRQL